MEPTAGTSLVPPRQFQTSKKTGKDNPVSNLSHQFDNAEYIEDVQRCRYARRHEANYSGAGFWLFNYPYMIGAVGSGMNPNDLTHTEDPRGDIAKSEVGATAPTSSGLGDGGTAASASGAAGGGMP